LMLSSIRQPGAVSEMKTLQETKHPWFAIRVKSNHEKSVCTHLAMRGFEVFLPVCRTRNRWADRYKLVEIPLFTGYVFVRVDQARPHAVLSTPGVMQIVGAGRNPEPVLEREIEAIRRAVDANCQLRECDFFIRGQRATVMSGALSGLEGTIVDLKQESRLILSISLLQRSVALEIDGSIVRVESDSAAPRHAAQLLGRKVS